MTAYVDDMRAAAGRERIAGYNGRPARWSHMFADSPAELADIARKLGLRPEWLQYPGTHREHYDVTETVRVAALKLGALPIAYPAGFVEILDTRRTVCQCKTFRECQWGSLIAETTR